MPTRRVGSFGPFRARGRIIPAVTPPILIGAGLAALAIGALVLRSFGEGYRIGRLLASAPRLAISEALAIARRGVPRYVAVEGRIDAADEFEDEHHRPLVFRRMRLEARRDGPWETVEEDRRAVDFEIREGLDGIAVDHAALGAGLVVIPRESVGTAGEVPDSAARVAIADLAPDTTVRIRIDQVSSVEHATVVGVPTTRPDGRPWMTASASRPLILSTLGRDDAMRLLAGGDRRRAFAAAVALVAGLALLALGVAWALVEAFG